MTDPISIGADPTGSAAPTADVPNAIRQAWSYPRHWIADVLASDGGVVHLRPIVPDDADRIVDFHSRLSERTRYLRYFGPTPTLAPREIARMTTVDHHRRVALVAELGGQIIAVGIYEGLADTGKPESAEVAFVVADEHQGRGLGPILLEHLAGAAAENGITRFEAEVLSENPNMVVVFRDAGYQLTRSFDGSTVHVEFLIDPSEAQQSVRNARERASEARSVANLLRPRSVAVIGASTDPAKVGHALLANIASGGFTGPIYPVNGPGHVRDVDDADPAGAGKRPGATTPGTHRGAVAGDDRPTSVRGIRAYPTVRDIPDPVDLAVVAVPASSVHVVLADCLAKGVRTLVVVSGGFAESGDAGLENERRMVAQVREHGMRLVGPNALGVANNDPTVALNATLAPRIPASGHVGFFCQSGALGIAILATAARRQLGLSTFVSAGNRADVSGNDLLQYWDSDDATEVVLLYLESFGNPRKFSRIARRVSRSKPIVAVKTGSGALSQMQAARAGDDSADDRVIHMVLEQAGVIQVETIAELFDCAAVFAYQPLPAGPRTRVIGNSSALGALAADVARHSGLAVIDITDLGPAATPEAFQEAVTSAVADDGVDAVIVVFVPPVAVLGEDHARALVAAASDSGKPIVSTFLGVEGILPSLSVVGPNGTPIRGSIPSYASPERAARALARSWKYASWRDRPDGEVIRPVGIDPEAARTAILSRLPGDGGCATLDDVTSAQILAHYGVRVEPFRVATSMHEASAAARELGFPVAVKASSSQWRGRMDREGARLDLPDATTVVTAFAELTELTGDTRLHVQKMAAKGVGTVIRASDDPAFGPVISFGLSGPTFELLGDLGYRAVPLTDVDARELVTAPRSAGLLTGYRGAPMVDIDAIVDLLQRISTFVDDIPEVREVICDPILAATDGAAVLSASIRIGPVPNPVDTGPRRLN